MIEIPDGHARLRHAAPHPGEEQDVRGRLGALGRPADLAQRRAQPPTSTGSSTSAVCDHIAIPESLASTMGTYWQDCISTLSWLAGADRAHQPPVARVRAPLPPPARSRPRSSRPSTTSPAVGRSSGSAPVTSRPSSPPSVSTHARRGKLVEEKLPPLIEALEHEFVDGVGAQPRPVQSPRPPVWIAGSSPAAIRRAATFGDGWLPQGPSNAEMVAKLQAQREEHGRADRPMMIGDITPFLYVGNPGWDVGEGVLSRRARRHRRADPRRHRRRREPAPGALQGPELRRDLRPDGGVRHRGRAHPHQDLTRARAGTHRAGPSPGVRATSAEMSPGRHEEFGASLRAGRMSYVTLSTSSSQRRTTMLRP